MTKKIIMLEPEAKPKKKRSPQAVESDRKRQAYKRARDHIKAKGMSHAEAVTYLEEKGYPLDRFKKVLEALNPTASNLTPEQKPDITPEKPPEIPSDGGPDIAQLYLQAMPTVEEPPPGEKPTAPSLEPAPETVGSAPPPSAITPPDVQAQAAKGVARVTVGTFFLVCQQVMGDEWQPTDEESGAILEATSAWFQEEGIGDMKPRTQVMLTVGVYALARMGKPKTRTKIQAFQDWLKARYLDFRARLAKRRGVAPPPVVSKEEFAASHA